MFFENHEFRGISTNKQKIRKNNSISCSNNFEIFVTNASAFHPEVMPEDQKRAFVFKTDNERKHFCMARGCMESMEGCSYENFNSLFVTRAFLPVNLVNIQEENEINQEEESDNDVMMEDANSDFDSYYQIYSDAMGRGLSHEEFIQIYG